jgi:hypothetical protein
MFNENQKIMKAKNPMKKITEITCKMSKSIILIEGHLTLDEVKKQLSNKNFLESDFQDSDDTDISFSHFTVDENEISKSTLNEFGEEFHYETHNISESYYFQDILDFANE